MGTKPIAEGATRQDMFVVDADQLTIIGAKPYTGCGADTDDGQEHPLWQERVKTLAADKIDPLKVRNVAYFGVKEPVLARKDGDRLVVIDGRHRVCWARAANAQLEREGEKARVRVRVIVEKVDDKTAIGLGAGLNRVREDDDVLTEARAMMRVKNVTQCSLDDIARDYGVTKQTVTNRLTLLTAHDDVLKALDDKRISPTAALEIAKMKREEQPTRLAAALAGDATVREIKESARAAKNGKEPAASGDGKGYNRPSIGDLRKTWAYVSENIHVLKGIHPADILRWAAGEVHHRQIGGFTAVLRDAKVIE